jgi:hypothetical protein
MKFHDCVSCSGQFAIKKRRRNFRLTISRGNLVGFLSETNYLTRMNCSNIFILFTVLLGYPLRSLLTIKFSLIAFEKFYFLLLSCNFSTFSDRFNSRSNEREDLLKIPCLLSLDIEKRDSVKVCVLSRNIELVNHLPSDGNFFLVSFLLAVKHWN